MFGGQHLKMTSSGALLVVLSAGVLFMGQTLPVSAIIALTDGGAFRRIWINIAQLSFPYYVVSAGVTSMVNSVGHHIGWLAALLLFSVMHPNLSLLSLVLRQGGTGREREVPRDETSPTDCLR
jgi:hypothetical protein